MITAKIQEAYAKLSSVSEKIFSLLQIFTVLKTGRLPLHIAFIMDGNRRWAKERGLSTKDGHKAGIHNLVKTLEVCYDIGVKEVTVYAFSIENFKRSQQEVEDFHVMFREALNDILKKISVPNHAVKIRILGNKSFLESDVQADFERLERTSSSCTTTKILNVCFAYTARDEICHSVRTIASFHEKGAVSTGEISERMVTQNLYVNDSGQPVDILVRTSGHQRLSDFLMWQCTSNCKFVFIDVLWPDFNSPKLLMIIFNWSFEQAAAYHRYRLFFDHNSRMPVDVHNLPSSPAFAVVSKAFTNK